MRVFVTGASGWIGSATVDELLAAGHEVARARPVRRVGGGAGGEGGHRAAAATSTTSTPSARAPPTPTAWSTWRTSTTGPTRRSRTPPSAPRWRPSPRPSSARERPFVLAVGRGRARPGPARHRGGPVARPTGRTRRAAGARTSRSTTSTAACARSAPASPRPCTAAATTGSSPTSSAWPARRASPAYVGDGTNRWSAVHRSDAARLVRLGLEQAPAGSRLHAVAEEGVPTRAIAEAIGRGAGPARDRRSRPRTPSSTSGSSAGSSRWTCPPRASAPASCSAGTPTGPTLIEDINAGAYTGA